MNDIREEEESLIDGQVISQLPVFGVRIQTVKLIRVPAEPVYVFQRGSVQPELIQIPQGRS